MVINIISIILLVIIDQVTKYLAVINLAPDKSITFIEGFIDFTYVENTGAAFSILEGQRWFFIVMTVIVIIGILIYMFKKKPVFWLERVSLILIVGGALGNFIDRCRLGYVVDMIELTFVNYAISNVADHFLVIGTIMFAIYVLFVHDARKKRLLSEKAEHSSDQEPDSPDEKGDV